MSTKTAIRAIIGIALFGLALILSLLLQGCTLETLLPPGAIPGVPVSPQTTQQAIPDAGPPEITPTQLLLVHGSWRCHEFANLNSDTVIFLHDGEIVRIVTQEGDFYSVEAGTHVCFVYKEAFQ